MLINRSCAQICFVFLTRVCLFSDTSGARNRLLSLNSEDNNNLRNNESEKVTTMLRFSHVVALNRQMQAWRLANNYRLLDVPSDDIFLGFQSQQNNDQLQCVLMKKNSYRNF